MNPLKQKTTMKKNSFLWAALSMTAALVMTACSSDDNDMTEAPVAPSTSKTIPYTVTVGGDEATTRATVGDDNRTLKFATGDKLYITGTDIHGVLDLKSGDEDKTTGATFSGDLAYSGSGSPSDGLSLTATLVSAQQEGTSKVSVDGVGAVTVNYPTAAYCATISDAVQQYSRLTGTSTYGDKAFTLTQQTAFLNFVITFDDGTTTSGTEFSAVVKDGETSLCTANVTTTTDNGNVVAKFVLPVASGTTLTSPTVTLGSKSPFNFDGKALAAKVYNVKRTYNHPDAIIGKYTVNASGKQVYFSKGNLRATGTTASTSTSGWTWSFATNQWDKIGNATANTSISGNGKISANGTVDLFGWSTSATYLGINNSMDNTNYLGEFSDWGSHSHVIAGVGGGWRTLSGDEWHYLFITRSTTSTYHYCKAKVNGVLGVILLPDDWSNDYYSLEKCDLVDLSFSDGAIPDNNKISLADWNTYFIPHGVVFLPTTGHRYASDNTSVEAPDGRLYYWSSTKGGTESGTGANANQMYIAGNAVSPNTGGGRRFGNAVRLVRDVK